ncbi:PDDEXK nuclease domain-containing protein [Candidatus Coxiella mudrowiae]|uniref:PDDEXK nuclease domain-containing protein n=1 Tax=Candidatus Coxiella mudrowiae TaxID=2054173 RepID=UPI003CC80FEE
MIKILKLKNENFSIGIILCRSKNKTIVEYTLHYTTKPISVSEYELFNQLPITNYQKLQKKLPSQELIAIFLDGIYSKVLHI